MLLELFTLVTSIFGVLMGCSYFLEAQRILKNRSAENISIPMFVILGIGTSLYLVYGIINKDIPIMLGFGLGVIGTWLVFGLALKYKNKNQN